MTKSILIFDEDRELAQKLIELIHESVPAQIDYFDDMEEAIEAQKLMTYSLIIFDPLYPSSFDGENFSKSIRMFNSINVNTPMIGFTEDIEFVAHITEKYNIHPETKLGPITKILNPVKMLLGVAA